MLEGQDFHSILRERIRNVNLSALSPPFLPGTFTSWRREYKAAKEDFLSYSNVVDHKLLPKFLKKVTKEYFNRILEETLQLNECGMSRDVMEQLKGRAELSELAAVMARWSVEIELAVDIFDRAQFYQLYVVPSELGKLYAELKSEWNGAAEPLLNRMYRFLLKIMSYYSESISGTIRSSITGIIATNLSQSRSMIITSVIYAYFSGIMPWPLLALLGTQLGWVLSGWLVTRLGHSLSNRLDSAQVYYHVAELRQHFEEMVSRLTFNNEESGLLISKCLHAVTKEEKQNRSRHLHDHLNSVLVKRDNIDQIFQNQFDEDKFIAENVIITEEEDWIRIDLPAYTLERLDGSWMEVTRKL